MKEQYVPGGRNDYELSTSITSFGIPYKVLLEINVFTKQYRFETGQEPTRGQIREHLATFITKGRRKNKVRTIDLLADMTDRQDFQAESIDLDEYDVPGPDATSETALNMVEHQEQQFKVSMAMEALTERQKIVLSERFGLNGPPKTLMEVAQLLGVTQAAVALLEKRALRNFRVSYKKMFGESMN